jgi:hypothetical protein
MKVHSVCILCLKTCKQPYSEWDDNQPELKFCPNFDAPRSKLPIETLDELIENVKPQVIPTRGVLPQDYQNKRFYDYFVELRKVYIPCSKCKHMIAPDELYRVILDEPVCQRCVKT